MKKIIIYTFCFVVIFGIIGRVGCNIYYNHKLESNFVQNERENDYKDGIPVHEINFRQYRQYIEFLSALPDYPPEWDYFTIDRPIIYYEEVNGEKVPAYEIPAGTELKTVYTNGYGFYSYPTYKKGWRWVRPFLEPDSTQSLDELPYYYVKLSDLEKYLGRRLSFSYGLENILRGGIPEAVFLGTRLIDKTFYEKGIFLSPDYFKPIWTWDCTLMIAVLLIVLTTLLVRKVRYRKAQ